MDEEGAEAVGTEEEDENEEMEETNSNVKEEEPVPPEKEWKEMLQLDYGSRIIKLRLSEGVLEKWAMYAIHDDFYWMNKQLSAMPSVETEQVLPVSPNQKLVLTRYLSEEVFEVQIHNCEEPVANENEEQHSKSEEVPEDEKLPDSTEQPGEEKENIEIELLILIVSQSVECAAFLLGHTEVSLAAALSWCTSNTTPNSNTFNTLFCDAIKKVSAAGRSVVADYSPIFEVCTMSDFGTDFCKNWVKKWQASGIRMACMVSASSLRSFEYIPLFYEALLALNDSDLQYICESRDEADRAYETNEDQCNEEPVKLAPYLGSIVCCLNSLHKKQYPVKIMLASSDARASSVCGIYTKRGKLNGRPRYWKGDPIAQDPEFWLEYTQESWCIRSRSDTVVSAKRCDFLPTEPKNWYLANESTTEIFLVPHDLQLVLPKFSWLEKVETDPVLSNCFDYELRKSPPYVLQLWQSDFLLFILGIEYGHGSSFAFHKLLEWKLRKGRKVTEPVGFPHLLFMGSNLLHSDAADVVFNQASRFIRHSGLVDLCPFLQLVAPELSKDQLSIIASQVYEFALEEEPNLGPEADRFCDLSRQYKSRFELACSFLDIHSAEVGDELRRSCPNIWLNDCFLFLAVLHNNIELVKYLLLEEKVPPFVRETAIQEPQPLLVTVLKRRQVEMLKMLLDLGFNLEEPTGDRMETGVEFVTSNFAMNEAQEVLAIWKAKEASRNSDPEMRFGLLRHRVR